MLLPMLRMISLRSDIDLMNETILEVCRRLSEIEDKPAIYKEAKKIFENSKKVPPAENYKIVETQKFYAEY
ncbi:MAG: hypothetical protein LBQ24_03535 [Candidatus Peribacteria bacterium]|jgi:hypothetical protein|nr:hypothetical protein [Candidatus Peribacteria bacterium]